MSRKKTEPAEPETVEMVNENGWKAHPLKADEETWLAAGWKRVAETKEKSNG